MIRKLFYEVDAGSLKSDILALKLLIQQDIKRMKIILFFKINRKN